MRCAAGKLLALAIALLAGLGAADDATAQEPLLRMTNVRVAGGEGNWHAESRFRIDWDQFPSSPQPQAVVYRLFDPQGQPFGDPVRSTEVLNAIGRANVPSSVPGIYTIEAWLENHEGQPGPPVTATLRFDDGIPAPATPQPPTSWVAGGKPVTIPIGHPSSPYPLSGIGGYAVSVDRGSGASPCVAVTWCSPEEIDLPGGIGDDSASLGVLTEGTYVVRVAAVSGSGIPSALETAPLRVDATPPDVALENPPTGWSREAVHVTAIAHDELSGMAAGSGTPFTAIAVDGGLPARASGDRVSTWVRGSGVHELSLYASDAVGNVADGQGSSPAPGHAWIRIDEEPPGVAFVPGRDPAEPERIEATVTDSLSGPSASLGSIEVRAAGSGERFEPLPTTVTAGRLVARWDSDSYPLGSYEFRASSYDAVGNSAHGLLRSDGARMVLTNPLKTPVMLRSGFAGKGRKQVPYGRGVRYGGRLLTIWGEPVAGATVAVTESFASGAKAGSRRTLAQTRADGTFSVYLAPGPSREVSAAYGGSPSLSRVATSAAQLEVRSNVRLHASAAVARVGGAPVVFSGRVARAGVKTPKETAVELQFRYPGADWSEFRTVKTTASGRFRYPYRFSDDDSRGIRFQFRALVPAQKGWPYDAGASRPVIVTGR